MKVRFFYIRVLSTFFCGTVLVYDHIKTRNIFSVDFFYTTGELNTRVKVKKQQRHLVVSSIVMQS